MGVDCCVRALWGGILMGAKQDILQVEDWETGDFYVGMTDSDS